MNGESPWANRSAASDQETDIPPWRRPADGRSFGRQQIPAERPFGTAPASGVPTQPPAPPGYLENAEIPSSGNIEPGRSGTIATGNVEPATSWSGERSRLADILGHRRSPGAAPVPHSPAPPPAPSSAAPAPSSAPPFPYEGDLDDSYRDVVTHRAAVPMARPTSGWAPATEPEITKPAPPPPTDPIRSRHALVTDTLAQGLPQVETAPPGDKRSADNPATLARPSYDSSSFQRRSFEPAPVAFPPAADDVTSPYAPPAGEPSEKKGALPQRVPAQPDVPRVPEPPSVEPSAEAPALARIATHLRRGDVVPAQERQEGFDVQDILAAVREVDGVRDASLRATPAGAHSLRLDLADGADPAEVSRQVARLLQDRMGLDAAMPGDSPAAAPFVPGQATRPGRAAVPTAPVSGAAAAPASAPPAPAPISAAPAPAPAPISVAPAPAAPLPEPRPREVRPSVAALVPHDASRPRPLDPGDNPGPRVVIENVHVNTFGADATVEVRLRAGDRAASGVATGPAVDGYLLRLCATATAGAIDELLSASQHEEGPARCFVEHAAAVSFGQMQVAVVVLLLSCGGGWVEQLAGSAVVTGDDRHAMVRATLAAVNRRVEALLA
ncbi:Daple [Actinoplanes aureus]|nr:Daple [Actinoplanes aureus]